MDDFLGNCLDQNIQPDLKKKILQNIGDWKEVFERIPKLDSLLLFSNIG